MQERRLTLVPLVLLLACAATPALAAQDDTPGSGDGASTQAIVAALDILEDYAASTETEASPFLPPGHGGTPPGQGGTPPGQTTPPGKGGTPPGQSDSTPGNSGNAPGHGGTPPEQSG